MECKLPRWKDYARCQRHQQKRWREIKGKGEAAGEKPASADFSDDQPGAAKLLLIDEATQQAWRVIAVEQHVTGRVLKPNTVGILEHQGYQVVRVTKGKS